MSRSKNKNRSEVEYLRGEVRRLKKQLRHTEKELKPEKEPDEPEEVETKVLCPKCKEGHVKLIFQFTGRDIFECTECDFRKTVKSEAK